MITPPLSISARPALTVNVASSRGVSPFSLIEDECTRALGCAAMTLQAVFVRHGERFAATELGRGPWDPGALHGGAPAALLAHAFEHCEPRPDLRLARITYELVRPVPIGELAVAARVTRAGPARGPARGLDRGRAGDRGHPGPRLARRAQRGRRAGSRPRRRFPGPTPEPLNEFDSSGLPPLFVTDAIEIRFVEGAFRTPGGRHRLVSPALADRRGRADHARCSAWPRPATSATGSPRAVAGRSTCSSTPT